MNKKIASILIAMTCFGLLPFTKTYVAEAAENKIIEVNVGTWTGTKAWTDSPQWEPFSPTKYGNVSATYVYDDGNYKGTLNATKIKAVPKVKNEIWVRNRWSTVKTGSLGPLKVSPSDAAPVFPNTINVSHTDPVLNKVTTGTIGKSGAPSVSRIAQQSKYISWGRANNYDRDYNTFYGVLSTSSTVYSSSYYFSELPDIAFIPQRKFYGEIDVIDTNDTNASVNTTDYYLNPLTGSSVRGMQWADATVIDANNFRYANIGGYGNGANQTQNMNNVYKSGTDILIYDSSVGAYRFRSEPTTIYKPKTTLTLRSGPSSSYPSKGTIPAGTSLERTTAYGDWIFVLHNGVGGWINKYDTTTSQTGGLNLRRYRRGITLLYDLTKTYDSYIQAYSGQIKLDDYIAGYDSNNWDIIVEYQGEIEDMRENNLKVSNLTASPISAVSETGGTNKVQNITVSFDVAHQLSSTPGKEQLNPLVSVKLNGNQIWSGTVGLAQNTSTKQSITIPNVAIPINTTAILHKLSVEVNGDRKIVERSSSGNPYSDNIAEITYPGVIYRECDIPSSRRTANTWTEQWVRTQINGALSGSAPNQVCLISSVNTTVTPVSYQESYKITKVYFRSKWSKDMHAKGLPGFNALPSHDVGFIEVKSGVDLKVKGGYGFEVIAVTNYATNRNIKLYDPVAGTSYSGPFGPGVCGFTRVTPSVTPIDTPNIMYINFGREYPNEVCRLMTKDSSTGPWYNNEKTFKSIAYTNFGAKAGIYEVSVSTPRQDKPNRFRGYEPESPIAPSNKNYLHDFMTFQIQVLGQDDLKSHIVQ